MESAARTAASEILSSPATRKREYRLVALTVAITLTACLSIEAPTVYLLDRARQRAAVERARFNCDQQAAALVVQKGILQIGNDLRRENRAVGDDERVRAAVLRLFGPELVKRLYATQARNEAKAIRRWDAKLRELRRLAQVDCEAVLQPSGVKTTPANSASR